jgi:hypothetical protein
MKFDNQRFQQLLEKNIFLSPEEKLHLQQSVEKAPPSRKYIFLQLLEDAEQDQKIVFGTALTQRPDLMQSLKKKHRERIRHALQKRENQQKESDQKILHDIESEFFE